MSSTRLRTHLPFHSHLYFHSVLVSVYEPDKVMHLSHVLSLLSSLTGSCLHIFGSKLLDAAGVQLWISVMSVYGCGVSHTELYLSLKMVSQVTLKGECVSYY